MEMVRTFAGSPPFPRWAGRGQAVRFQWRALAPGHFRYNSRQSQKPVFEEDQQVASVMERVTDIVAEQLGVDKEKITPATSFVNDLGADSLDQVELVMELEEEFDINIPDDAAEKIQTVGQAVEYIEAGMN